MSLLAIFNDSNKELHMATRKTRSSVRRAGTRRYNTRRPTRRTAKGGSPWSREEISFMRKYYRNNETSWVARQLGRTVYSVRYKASDLNIRKARPSVWRGNTGTANTTRQQSTRRSWSASSRRIARPTRRSKSRTNWRQPQRKRR